MKIEVHYLKNLSGKRLLKVTEAIRKFERASESQVFKSMIMTAKMSGMQGKTNSEIAEMFYSGADLLNNEADGDLDLYLSGYYKRFSKVIGYTFPGSVVTWMNRKFIDLMKVSSISGNICHEYMHKLGFHDDDRNSVPYTYGRAMTEAAEMEP